MGDSLLGGWGCLVLGRRDYSFGVTCKARGHNLGLLCLNAGLLWGTMASCFGLLGFPGRFQVSEITAVSGIWSHNDIGDA